MSLPTLTELVLKRHYQSDEDDIMSTFYRPLLDRAVLYQRAVGYFSEQSLISCAAELSNFIGRDGRIQLIIGCFISPEELASVSTVNLVEAEKLLLRQRLIATLRAIEAGHPPSAKIIGTLVAAGIAELRFAVRQRGIYHEKFGIFEDGDGNKVAFIGSANETEAALAPGRNHESFAVFKSIEPEIYAAYGEGLEQRFESLWAGDTKETRIYTIDEESLAVMRSLAAKQQATDAVDKPVLPRLAASKPLRDYQQEALKAWQANRYRGILAMATGTGKTRTAIEAVRKFRQNVPNGAVVVTVPYQNLALQWIEALREHGMEVCAVFANSQDWVKQVQNNLLAAQLGPADMPCFVCVNNTFKSDRFQELLALLDDAVEKNHLLIVDECHHFNSPEHIAKLPVHFKFRLGLSATPYDQFAQHYLDTYFGQIVFEFSLARAIDEGFLTPYRYHILPVRLDEQETAVYEDLTRKIVQIAGSEETLTPENLAKVQPLLLKRARLVGACRDKLTVLRDHLERTGRQSFTLFYCGDGSVDDDEGGSARQVERVSGLLHDVGWSSARITADESLTQREALLVKLKEQRLDAIVSIKVLDEGIDIPDCRSAYLLASQTSDRQGIQRRGRVLRKAEGKDKAELYDFVVLGGVGHSSAMKSLARRELRRADNFASHAIGAEALQRRIHDLRVELGISIETQHEHSV
ncbi:DEAD/DEAH box helicase [Massilia sp. NEAU-DD11]|uniref:DEAD/DEAH box helicase n=2 Tax=Massilia cellulosiltytica TaxID=2683234 RepID=A0A7X3G7L2_9BURK|nr:DEAD/DEAH box helicase [Telluria cellulosilytica]